MPSLTAGKALLSLAGVVTSVGCYIADYNETHVFNPNWPPHAKFHNGQTMSMGLCLGLCTLYYTWRSPSSSTSSSSSSSVKNPTDLVKAEAAKQSDDLNTAALFGSLYWITQLSGILYPGALAMDPEFGTGFPQFWICMGLFSVIGAGYGLERRRIGLLVGGKVE